MSNGYNPYRQSSITGNSLLDNLSNSDQTFFNKRLARLSLFGRNYQEAAIKNAKGIHANEDISQVTDSSGYNYTMFSRKVHAIMQERQTIAALSGTYIAKVQVLREYATKVEIRDFVTKMANEIVVYGKDKKFCEIVDLPESYGETERSSLKEIFENVYTISGFADGSLAWDLCRDWLVEGYLCREIIYDTKGKNIAGFQKLDPLTVIPIIDPETGLKLWIQNANDNVNRRILLDSEIIYISYSGSSNYMETSYVEPLVRPYNELKSIERSKLLFNLINATMHKEFIIPTQGLSPMQAEQEIATLIADYKDHVAFDDTTGLIYIDGSKDLPYSKEYWLPNPGDVKPEMNIIEPGGHDLNENSMLTWFYNALKRATKFPFTRLDTTNGGGNLYSIGGDLTHDDYNFKQYVERLRTIFKEILLKPIILQLLLNFPELEKNNKLYNDIDLKFYGHSELIKAKTLSNLQAMSSIAADLQNNLKDTNDKPILHPSFIMKHVMEFTDEQIAENAEYWKKDNGTGTGNVQGGNGGAQSSNGGTQSGDGAQPGAQGGDTTQAQDTTAQTGTQTQSQPPAQTQTPPAQ